MSTLQELFCVARGCPPDEFHHRVLRLCLHRRVRVLWPVIMHLRPDYFDADRELIAQAGRAKTLHELEEQIRDFTLDSRNREWWRHCARFRMSTRRLRRLAREHLTKVRSGAPASLLA